MKNTLTLLLLLAAIGLAAQDTLQPFSELSFRETRGPDFTSVVTTEGIIYSFNPGSLLDPFVGRRFYFVGFDGQVRDSLQLADRMAYGDLIESDGRYFFAGMRFTGEDTISNLKVLLEFDASMNLVGQREWENVALSGGVNLGLGLINVYGAHRVEEDTLFSVFQYFVTNPFFPNPFPSQYLQFEKLGINHGLVEFPPPPASSYFYGGAITERYFYAFGQLGGTPLPGGGVLNPGIIIRRDRLTGAEEELDFGNDLYGYFARPFLVQYHNGRFYANYENSNAPLDPSACGSAGEERNSTIIDVRDEDFNLIRRIDLPACGGLPTGRTAFSFAEDGSIYHTTAILGTASGAWLFKFDSTLQERWRIPLPSAPFSSSVLPDGHIIVECAIKELTQEAIVLYKVSPDGLITSTTTLGNAASAPTFHPNPFTNELSLLALPERPLRVDVFGMDGRPHGSYEAQNGTLQLGHLPGGAYVLRVSDSGSGAFLGAQQVVKR